jgi:hypothetical protein
MIGLPEWETADESRLAKMWSIEDKRHVAPAVCNGRAARSFPASFSQQHLHRHPLASHKSKTQHSRCYNQHKAVLKLQNELSH